MVAEHVSELRRYLSKVFRQPFQNNIQDDEI